MKQSMFPSSIFGAEANNLYNSAHSDKDLSSLVEALADNDTATMYHSNGVGRIAAELCTQTDLKEIVSDQLSYTKMAIAHDIGKTSISSRVLRSAQPLTDSQWKLMRQHPSIGFRTYREFYDYTGSGLPILMHHRFQEFPYPDDREIHEMLQSRPEDLDLLNDRQTILVCAGLAVADCIEAMHPNKPHQSHSYRARDYPVQDLSRRVYKSILSTPFYVFNRKERSLLEEMVECAGRIAITAVESQPYPQIHTD